jgi:enoyl-CoA hydratase/carnithine racemase
MSSIEVERRADDVVVVWLSNPGRLNALSDALVVGLCEAFDALAGDDQCRIVVLRGRDGVFCAGRDLADLGALQGKGPDAVARMYGYLQRMNEAVYDCPHPTIALVERYALGIGTMLASWCDIVVAEADAQFGYPEVRHGITPYGAVPTMLNTLGGKALADLLYTGRRIAAAEAVGMGIATRAVAAAALEAELAQVLDDLLKGSAAAIRLSKAFVRECETLGHRQGIARATERHIAGIGAPDLQAGVSAFLGRRRPGST